MISSVYNDNGWAFTVWAPEKEKMQLHIVSPFEQEFKMQKNSEGYFSVEVETTEKKLDYFFRPDGGKSFPDPASQYQPQGVHGPSQTVDHSFSWNDQNWKGLSIEELILYELHVGLFTPEGSFEAIVPRLDDLKELGINALELMPVCQFPGNRNWGYDGVYPYAVQNSYGGPGGLKKLVDACHQKGIAVFLDVVYNHLGPEGNYFSRYAPYFTNKYCTPWGDAINYDGEWSDGVRDFFSDNVLYWFKQYHIDGLRCDAIHTVFDNGAVHFWELIHDKVKQLEERTGRQYHLIAESDLNSPKVVKHPSAGGYGFRAQWLDDFHHALYVLLNPSDQKRYYDFGTMEQLVKSYNDGFVHSGEWVKYRKRRHGTSSAGIPGEKFVVFNQNHDQVGNRADGKRLCMLIDFERTKLAAAAVLLAAYLPMLFMGEEYADDAPFFYFVSHSDVDLIKAVQEGRKKEFEDFGFDGSVPDPQDENTFYKCRINWDKKEKAHHRIIFQWHKELIRLRKTLPPLKNFQKKDGQAKQISSKAFSLLRNSSGTEEKILCLFNFSESKTEFSPDTKGKKILDSKQAQWMEKQKILTEHPGILSAGEPIFIEPHSVVVYSI